MKSLENFNSRQGTPVDGINVPDRNRSHYSTDSVTKQANRDSTQDDSGRTQRHIVKELLRCEHF